MTWAFQSYLHKEDLISHLPQINNAMALIDVKETIGAAKIKVYVLESTTVADLLVYESVSRSEAQGCDELWCYVSSGSISSATVFFVSSRIEADLLICLVSSRSKAGWNNKKHRLVGQIG